MLFRILLNDEARKVSNFEITRFSVIGIRAMIGFGSKRTRIAFQKVIVLAKLRLDSASVRLSHVAPIVGGRN
jgi:hypothetical protein